MQWRPWKATPREPRLIIRAAADRRELSIQVIDNGPGLDDPENIFEPFISTKKDGMGIGLAVSRSIVEAHGGNYGQKIILTLALDSLSNFPWQGVFNKRTPAIVAAAALVY
jgi:signal transduction histidine kinase